MLVDENIVGSHWRKVRCFIYDRTKKQNEKTAIEIVANEKWNDANEKWMNYVNRRAFDLFTAWTEFIIDSN